MSDKMKRLGDAELEIMLSIWEADQPVTASYILEQIKCKRKWALSTLMTILSRLCDKGFVSCDRSTRTNYYSAVIPEQDYKASEGRTFLGKLYGNSVGSLITSLYSSKVIDDNDLSELRRLIDEIGKEE